MKLDMQVGLCPLPRPHCVRWEPSSPRKGAQQPPLWKFTGAGFACVRIISGPCLLWPVGWMDQDAIWYEGRPRPRPDCVRWGPNSLTLPKGAQPPIFGPCLLWPNGWLDQDATWYEGRPRPTPHCVRWGPSSLQRSTHPNFRPMSTVAKRSPISATAEHLYIVE